jgi:hypothetical protein
MLTRASLTLVAALILASASNAFAANAYRGGNDVPNSTFSYPDQNEEGRFDHAKGYLG